MVAESQPLPGDRKIGDYSEKVQPMQAAAPKERGMEVVMANFMCQCGWMKACSDSWENTIQGVSGRNEHLNQS